MAVYYYAFLNSDDICTAIYTMPAPITGSNFIAIASNDQSLIGQYFDRSASEFKPVYYYAETDNKKIVIKTVFYLTPQVTTETLLQITFEQYQTVTGLYWNGSEFIEPPISILAVASTDQINYKHENVWLTSVLEDMQSATADNSREITETQDTITGIQDKLAEYGGEIHDLHVTDNVQAKEISGIADEVSKKADSSHVHSISDIKGLEGTLGEINNTLANDGADIEELDEKVEKNKSEIVRIDTNVNAVINAVNDHESVINDLTESVSSNAGNISSLAGSIGNLANGVSTLAGTVESIESGVETLTDKINSYDEDIDRLTGRVGNVETEIENLSIRTEKEFNVLAENVSSISSKANNHENRISSLSDEVGAVERSVEAIRGNVASINTEIDGMGADIEKSFKAVDTDISTLTSEINSINRNISATNTNVTNLTSSVAKVESRATSLENRATANEKSITANKNGLSALTSRVGEVEADISNIDTEITGIEGEIADVEASVVAVNTRVTTVENNATALTKRVSALETRATTIETNATAVAKRVTDLESKAATLEKNVNAATSNISSLTTRTVAVEKAIGTAETDINNLGIDIAEIRADQKKYYQNTGGAINGDVDVKGVFRVQGTQAYFYNTSTNTATIGTNNAVGVTIAGSNTGEIAVNSGTLKTYSIIPRTTSSNLGSSSNRWKAIYSQSSVNVASDERLKSDVKPLDRKSLASFIDKLDVVNYKYIGCDEKRIGLIAQRVIEADPKLAKYFVSQSADGYYNLKPADFVFPLIAAIQELKREIEELKK